jgi:hypothetical protein
MAIESKQGKYGVKLVSRAATRGQVKLRVPLVEEHTEFPFKPA